MAIEEALGRKSFDSLPQDGVALTNKPFTFTRIDLKTADSSATNLYTLDDSDCIRLLKELPALKDAYEALVPLKKSAKDFWEKFLQQNLHYRTQVFKGNNPVFIPFTTDERDYEDRYKYQERLILEPRSKDDILGTDKKRLPLIDVDYMANTGMLETPLGYGTY